MIARNVAPVQDRVVDDGAAQLPAGHWSERLGWFRFYFGDDRCVWSPQLLQMHGYRPGTAAPGIQLALSHVHPDDYEYLAATVDRVRRTRQPFSSRHRIVDTRYCIHDVVVIGAPFCDTHGAPVGMQGFCVDLTPATSHAPLVQQCAYDRLAEHLRAAANDPDYQDRRQRIRAATRC